VLDVMKLTIQSDTEDMADDLGTIFYSDGTGNTSKDPAGIDNIVDDGTVAAAYGGLTRADFAGSVLNSTRTASGGTLTLALIDTLWNAVTSGSQKPTIGVTTEAVFAFYGQLLRPQERIVKEAGRMKGGLQGGTGFTGLDYNGKAIVADEKATAQRFHFLNEDFLHWYALPYFSAKPIAYKSQVQGNDYDAPLGLGFSWTDWIVPANGASVVGHIYLGGQFFTNNPKRHGKLTGITGI